MKLKRGRGFTIVDVLVALLLLAPCIIGIAALKAERVRKNDSSTEHDRAVKLGTEVGKLMAEPIPGFRYETSIGLVCNREFKSERRERLAANALACWQDKVEAELPNGTSEVSFDSKAIPAAYVVTISWSNPTTGTASYVLRVPEKQA